MSGRTDQRGGQKGEWILGALREEGEVCFPPAGNFPPIRGQGMSRDTVRIDDWMEGRAIGYIWQFLGSICFLTVALPEGELQVYSVR